MCKRRLQGLKTTKTGGMKMKYSLPISKQTVKKPQERKHT